MDFTVSAASLALPLTVPYHFRDDFVLTVSVTSVAFALTVSASSAALAFALSAVPPALSARSAALAFAVSVRSGGFILGEVGIIVGLLFDQATGLVTPLGRIEECRESTENATEEKTL